jgi:hypothetical protein
MRVERSRSGTLYGHKRDAYDSTIFMRRGVSNEKEAGTTPPMSIERLNRGKAPKKLPFLVGTVNFRSHREGAGGWVPKGAKAYPFITTPPSFRCAPSIREWSGSGERNLPLLRLRNEEKLVVPSLAFEAGSQRFLWQIYRKGILVNLLNSKVPLFFLAFIPQGSLEYFLVRTLVLWSGEFIVPKATRRTTKAVARRVLQSPLFNLLTLPRPTLRHKFYF